MTTATENVLKKALELSPMDRALLVEHLLSSFEIPERAHLDLVWAKEAEDRIDAYEKGLISSKSAKKVFKNIK